ncbi:MAG TPA: histidine kinase dimerization/phospho-acceptor domain-containing protein, partial [Pontibacter sp.]
MNKHTIIGVIVLMSISLLGVVGLQLYWINDAIRVKQAQFDHSVNEALTSAIDKLETQEAVSVVADRITALQQPTQPDTAATLPAVTKQEVTQLAPARPKPDPLQSKSAAPQPAASETKKPAAASPQYATRTAKTIVPGGERRLIRLESGDTLYLNRNSIPLQALKLLPPDVRQSITIPPVARVQASSSARGNARILSNPPPSVLRLSADSLAKQFKTHTMVFSFSLDTLQMLAGKLDSLQQFTRFHTDIRPATLEGVEVRNDSIFILHQGSRKPVYVKQSGKERLFTGKATTLAGGVSPEVFFLSENGIKYTVAKRPGKELTATKEKENKKPLAAQQEPKPQPKPAAARKTATEKLERKKEKLNEVVQKMVVEYVAKDEPLQKRLNLNQLPLLLQDEFAQKGISLPFGYHVVSAANDTIAAKSVGHPDEDTYYYAASLFPNDLIEKPDYLAVYFPDNRSHALSSLSGMMVLSGLFTLIIIATFGTTIHIIFKQKKLSEMKNDFINNMTHEFKTPIATISLATDSIANPKVYEQPDKIKYYTSIIRQENKRMNAQVEKVLQTALLE